MRTSIGRFLGLLAGALTGCATTATEPPPRARPAPTPAMRIDFEVFGPPVELQPIAARDGDGDGGPRCADRAQAPELKLAVGHYWSPARNIGLVIDRSEAHAAKIRFDHAARSERLFARYAWHHVEYYRAKHDKVLDVRSDGTLAVYVAGQEIWVVRDCDADPLEPVD